MGKPRRYPIALGEAVGLVINILGYVMIAIGAIMIAFRLMQRSKMAAIDPREYPTRTSPEEQQRYPLLRLFQIYREDVPVIEKDLAARMLTVAVGLVVIGLVIALFA